MIDQLRQEFEKLVRIRPTYASFDGRYDGADWIYDNESLNAGFVGFCLGRQSAPEKAASDWISVKDKPPSPEQGARILAYGNGYVFECEFDDGVWCNLAGDSFTHWMPPLPLPPSVEVKK